MDANTVWIAKILGPVVLVLGIGMAANPAQLQKVTAQFLGNAPLILISGVLAMVTGLSIVNLHNHWAWDWPLIITLFGWALTLGGATRIIAPQLVQETGKRFLDRPWATRVSGVLWGALGAYLALKGYAVLS